MSDTADRAGFHVGWLKPQGKAGRWRALTQGATHDEAMLTLLQHPENVGNVAIWVGLAGQHPNGNPVRVGKPSDPDIFDAYCFTHSERP